MFDMDALIDDILNTVEEARKFKYAGFILRADLKKLLENYCGDVAERAYENAKDDFESSNENYNYGY